MSEIKRIKASELTPDAHNANLGTERGQSQIEASLRQFGAGRSILVDKHGRVIAGNKTLETAADVGLDDVILVQTDGKQIVAVQRTDLDLAEDGDARLLAYADNRAGEVSLQWDFEVVQEDIAAGLDLSGMWQDWELGGDAANDPDEEWQGMPEFEHKDLTPYQSVIVHFAEIEDRDEFAILVDQTVSDDTKSIWFPKAKITTYANKEYS